MNGFSRKNAAGFSLLELMVVVAIIGVLAAVAVPRYNIFRARARQAEAKSNLGVIFTLQEAFKIDKEVYYDGKKSRWGGEDMLAGSKYPGYKGGGAACVAADQTNKLGFRLANCSAARYRYYMVAAGENQFMAHAFAPSDVQKRIFPGCSGTTRETNGRPNASKSGKTKCEVTAITAVTGLADASTQAQVNAVLTGAGGDGFCLDHNRTIDNFVDIVASTTCSN